MTDEEWKASFRSRLDRLESADSEMQNEINEIKASVRESKIIVQNMATMQDQRLQNLEEKLILKLDTAEKKTDALISGVRKFSNAVWLAVIGAAVVWIINGGLVL